MLFFVAVGEVMEMWQFFILQYTRIDEYFRNGWLKPADIAREDWALFKDIRDMPYRLL